MAETVPKVVTGRGWKVAGAWKNGHLCVSSVQTLLKQETDPGPWALPQSFL